MAERRVFDKNGTVVGEGTLREFENAVAGETVRPGDESYETARRVWNGMVDKHPSIIIYCVGVEDVIKAVNFARLNNLLVAVRGGGHNVAGNAVCDGGLVIDLSRMKRIQVDAGSSIARAEAGLTWGELDRATQAYGLATTGGIVSRTGIAGLTLGGGIGWLMRAHGLTCDNLLSVEIVTADGRLLKASETENADLFWGVRGGGGNFGIVTTFEYRLHRVEPVLAGMIVYPSYKAVELLRFYRDYIAAVPDELTSMFLFLTVQPVPYLPERIYGMPAVAVHFCCSGSIEEGRKIVRPLMEICPQLADSVGVMSYVGLQSMLDDNARAGLQNYWKSAYLGALSDACVDTIADCASRMTSPLTQVHIQHMGGAVSRISEEMMAFSHRDALCVLNIVSKWEDPGESDNHMKWTRTFAEAMMPFSTGVYVNFLGEEGEDRIRAAYRPDKYDRLVALKNIYDPENFFRLNQNIRPWGSRDSSILR